MRIATAQQMYNIDRRAVAEFGIPGAVLMENAAAALAGEMERWFEGLAGKRVAVVCGKGNNGGDGLALARRLRIRGVPVRVALLAPFAALRGEAKLNLSILRKTDVEVIPNASDGVIAEAAAWSDIVVDALLGVGASLPLTARYARAVDLINRSGRPVVAVDIPTGVDADTGAVPGPAVEAELTVAMALPKRGLLLYPGADHAGAVRTADIGIPVEVLEREAISLSLIDEAVAWGMLQPRRKDSHKGDYGRLMIVAGSLGKMGAAVMAAQGALRSGAGLVTVATPAGQVPVVQQQVREAMCLPAGESIDGTLGIGSENELLKAISRMDACAVGPGLTPHAETAAAVLGLLKGIAVPAVFDADGLNALAGNLGLLARAKAPLVLTPHPGEMARLLNCSIDDVQRDRLGVAGRVARQYGVAVVLKGAGTVVAGPDGDLYLNSTGNPGMATGGAGDVLTGVIGSLLAQGYPATQAACLAVYLHGRAGDLAAAERGEAGMIAGDVIEALPEAIMALADR